MCRFALVFCTAAAVAACSDGAGDGDGDRDGGVDADGGGEAGLQCDSIAWCTSYGAVNDTPLNIPPLTGGAIADGMYRAQEGTFSAEALLIEGDKILFIGDSYSNRLGTFTVNGDKLTVTLESDCDYRGTETRENPEPFDYLFAVAGNNLYLDNQNCSGACEPDRWQRVSSLCETDEFFDCRVSNCQCVESSGQGLPESAGNPTSFCTTI